MKKILGIILVLCMMSWSAVGISEVLIQDTTSEFPDVDVDTIGVSTNIGLSDGAEILMTTDGINRFFFNDSDTSFIFTDSSGDGYLGSYGRAGLFADLDGGGIMGIEADSDYLQIWSYDFASSYIDITASGDIHIQPSSDTSDYIVFNTTANTPKISTIGDSDLIIDSSSNNVKLDSNVDITDDLNVTGDVFIGLNITGPYTANLVDGGPSEFQVNIKDRLRVYGEVIVDDLNTGGNAGTDLCFDIVGALCECGHCAGEGP